ncbi:hypothetical protein ACKVMT_13585 [Halobacteriales archaeon Cl-PHB]
MDVPDPANASSHEREGVEVSKWLDDSLFSFPAVAYQLASSREEPVTVRLVESVPEDIDPDELGFHPSYGSEYWHADGDAVRFEYTLRPTGGFITVCGIRTDDQHRIEEMLGEPTELSVLPSVDVDEPPTEVAAEDADGIAATEDSGVAAVAGGAEGESTPDTDDAAGGAEAETTAESVSSMADGAAVRGDTDDDGSAVFYRSAARESQSAPSAAANEETDEAEAEVAETESSGAERGLHEFVRAMQDGEVTEEDVRVLREIFVSEMLGSESVQARLRHLQGQVADLQAYTGALEEFIDENGDGQQIIERHEREVAALQDELSELRDALAANDDAVAALSGDVDDLEAKYERLDDDLADLDAEFDRVDDDLADLTGDLSTVSDDFDSLEGTVTDLDERVPGGDFEERFEELEREVVELRNWKENMRQIFS